ncbi:family with sequence similarity 120, member C, partial [Chelydra serpentina]
ENPGVLALSPPALPKLGRAAPCGNARPGWVHVLCSGFSYMIQWPGGRILHRHELDVFLAQAVSSQLYEPDHLQELKIEKLDARGVQLAALFMSGVDTALFANDACGQPVPWEHCCPWIYFDGKLFQSKLIKATRARAPLIDLCDGQAEQAAKVERMRQSILEGVNFNRQAPPPLLPPPPFMPAMAAPFYSMPLYPRTTGSVPPPTPGRSRGFTGERLLCPLSRVPASLLCGPTHRGALVAVVGSPDGWIVCPL